ncbi:cupin domain-containing protein [Aliiruegeria sabulilitoris]|uniref:cupin domain-containing protein n=1 Tax=Aliiruegeria sabulilitoris TaxID=1510458 RepID=UPI000830A7B0|nr:cupin domain-containing protein [Aliiruegeria sabulilitoris]NDR55816.1 cupin domain-containing protein [Pseudoruegeria sp. M32A2M]
MSGPVIHIDETEDFPVGPQEPSERFGATVSPLARALGLSGLGAMLTEVAPGKRAFPFHNHLGNDELFVILEGEGIYRFGEQEFPVRVGSVCGAPRGGPETAHQLINTGAGPLRYVAVSTMQDPDICEYPDSGKFSAFAVAPGPDFQDAHLRFVGRREDGLNYWEGET